MKNRISVVVLLTLFASPVSGADQDDERRQAKMALQTLDDWHNEQPEVEQRYLHIVCWTPSDRELPTEYQARLTRIMKHIQDFYRREMERFGFKERTIGLQFDDDQQLILHTVSGQHKTDHYAVGSGNEIKKECLPTLKKAGIDPERETVMIMCNLATWDAENLVFRHKSPYYAGGSFRNGTAWQLDSPELDSENLKLTKPILRDGQYGRISLGKHNSIFIGGVAHELGHALGLPHCKARPDETYRGTALMGSGNRTYGDELRGEGRGSFLTLAHALRLASHPQFSGSVKGLRQRANATIDELSIEANGKAIQVSGIVKGSPPVYAVIAYFDPDGGGDYDATTATAIPTADGRFKLSSDALKPGKGGQLRLFPLHVNGSAAGQMSRTRFQYSYDVARDGTPDLSTIQLRATLQPLIDALASGNGQKAKAIAAELKPGNAANIAAHLVDFQRPTQTPAEFDGEATEVELTKLKPESSEVGWARPTFNRVPDPSTFIESGGHIFETGIYAHAPARHVYQLDEKWNSFSGKVGIASGHGGTVQFECKGDGKSIWKSKIVRAGEVVDFEIRLNGVHKLDLVTHPTNDGPGSDWGLWLNPVLSR